MLHYVPQDRPVADLHHRLRDIFRVPDTQPQSATKKNDFHILTPRGTSSSSLGGSAIACAHHPSPELHCNVGNRLQWLISLRMPIAPKRVELAIRSLKVPHAIVLVRLFRLTIVDPFPRGGLSPHARTAMWKLPPKSCLQSPLHDQMP